VNADNGYGRYRRLAMAAILNSMKGASTGNQEARAWLMTDGLLWLDLVGIQVSVPQMEQAIAIPLTRSHIKSLLEQYRGYKKSGNEKK
jgi:hypothetical protein